MSERNIGLIYDEVFLEHLAPKNHPESPARLKMILGSINESSIKNNLLMIKPRKASIEELCFVHNRDYVESLAKRKSEGYLDGDDGETYFSSKTFETASMAAGAVLTAVDTIRASGITRVFCAVRPPGHHAERAQAGGFCIFNNIAIGARYAQQQGFKRIFIIDFDAHHGNGTQHVFENEKTIFYFSSHQYQQLPLFYPGTGKRSEQGIGPGYGFTRNFPLAAGSGNKEYAEIYQGKLPKLIKRFKPDLILVSAGFDIHHKDPLTNLKVSDGGIRLIAQSIMRVTAHFGVPIIFVLEGGYNLSALSRGVVVTLEEMAC